MTDSLALCGAGLIAGAHVAVAQILRIPIVAVASRTPARAAELAQRAQSRSVPYAELPAGATLVAVCTPPQMHAVDTLRLLQSGAAVLLEKPLCTTLADADLLVDAAAAHQQRLLYAENLAYAPAVSALLGQVGALGTVNHLEVRTLQAVSAWGNFTSDEWGGGALFNLGAQSLAVAVLTAGACGAGPVQAVSARLEGGAGHHSDEHAEVFLTFASGLVGRIVSSWKEQAGQQQWDLQVSSETGVLRIDFWPEPTLERNGEPVRLPPPRTAVPLLEHLGYLNQFRAFAHDSSTGSRPLMDAEFGRLILDIICCAYQSAGRDGAGQSMPFSGDRTKTPLQLWHRS